jgi:murein DD-endopeptidase MepM/ murein hydrolase activator NlpD
MAYDQTVVDDFNRALHARGVTSPKVAKALFEAGIVESGLRNLNYGDRDSLGALQQRPSQGWKNATDPYRGALDFLDQAIPLAGKYGSSGQLAQAVQRSAFPGRYNQVGSQAASLLGRLSGGSGSVQPQAVTTSGGSSAPSGTSAQPLDAGQGSDFTSLLQSLLSKPQPAQGSVTPINAPAFAAAPRMPTGFHPLNAASVPVQQPQSGVSDALSLVAALGGTGPSLLGSPGVSQAGSVPGTGPGAPASAAPARSGASGGSGRYPVAKLGKIIGVPYQGTHTLGNWQSDNAIDIAVPIGTPMVALQDGVVVKVTRHPQGAGRFAGDQITIRGANGNEYFYAHGVSDVQAGQKVRKGQELGTTGSANGVAHLHYAQMNGDPRMHAR